MDRDKVYSSCLKVMELDSIKGVMTMVAMLSFIFLYLISVRHSMINPADHETLKAALLDLAIVITLTLAATLSMLAFKRPAHQILALMAVVAAAGALSYVRMDVPVVHASTASGRTFSYNAFAELYVFPLFASLIYLNVAFHKWCVERNLKRATAKPAQTKVYT